MMHVEHVSFSFRFHNNSFLSFTKTKLSVAILIINISRRLNSSSLLYHHAFLKSGKRQFLDPFSSSIQVQAAETCCMSTSQAMHVEGHHNLCYLVLWAGSFVNYVYQRINGVPCTINKRRALCDHTMPLLGETQHVCIRHRPSQAQSLKKNHSTQNSFVEPPPVHFSSERAPLLPAALSSHYHESWH